MSDVKDYVPLVKRKEIKLAEQIALLEKKAGVQAQPTATYIQQPALLLKYMPTELIQRVQKQATDEKYLSPVDIVTAYEEWLKLSYKYVDIIASDETDFKFLLYIPNEMPAGHLVLDVLLPLALIEHPVSNEIYEHMDKWYESLNQRLGWQALRVIRREVSLTPDDREYIGNLA